MDKTTFLVVLAGMFAATYVPRALPLVALSRVKMPQWVVEWLEFVPSAVLAALLAPGLLMPHRHIDLSLHNDYLIAAIPTMLVAIRTRSLALSVAVGVGIMVLLQRLY
ncbi:MAG: AzlD domain-containing protein [Firmicutes bacterium]|nr:AzlD domain-containing protein [Bacillota bacterium]